MKKILNTLTLLFLGTWALAQSQPHAQIFSNFNYNLSQEDNNFKAFEVNRAYLGYSHSLSDDFKAKVTFDVGNNSSGSTYTAFLKIASLSWKANDNMNVNFGMIGAKNFKFMEKAWGYRYIYKSLQDEHKWANSADVGVSLDYVFNSKLNLDAQVLNGEGYKKEQESNGLFRGSAGMTYKASDNLAVRVHYDVVPRETYGENVAHQNTTSAAMAYSGDGYKVGLEYNIQENAQNVTDKERTGISAYGSYDMSNGMSLFGRYDELASDEDWNISRDGSFMILGIEKEMVKGVKVALNYQSWTNTAENAEAEESVFLNFEYKF
ncbi:hypothetical protein N9E30_01345 [Flavobacteriales bacterium]|jgi:hypothetical protein|nr:hypothetical protein [Flavobacteriales bacterium]